MVIDQRATNPLTAEPPSALSTVLRGGRLLFARSVWLFAVAVGAAMLVGLAPMRTAQLQGLAADNAGGLAMLGVSPAFFVRYLSTFDVLVTSVFIAAGILIFL